LNSIKMKRKISLLLLCGMLMCFGAYAQIQVSGKVTDAAGGELPGVSIAVKGTNSGTTTGPDGTFTIPNVPGQNSVMVFSFVGYISQEVTVGSRKTFNITLAEENRELNEVVVVAYGTSKKKDLTGAVSTIDSKTIAVQANSTVTRALEGVVPGLQVSSVDGQPGLDMGIRLRGAGSTSQNSSNALIVIDGVPAEHENALSSISPKDIASISVLKDAASTAVYGSRGANGVVMVTTKRGTKGKARIGFEGRWGVNYAGALKFDKITNSKDIYEYAWQAIYNSVRYGVGGTQSTNNTSSTNVQNPNMSHEAAAQFASAHLFDYTGSTTNFQSNLLGNWMLYDVPGAVYTPTGSGVSASSTMSGAYLVNPDGKLNPNARELYPAGSYDDFFLEKKLRQEYNLTASGGTDKIDYFTSLGYLEDPSYIRGSKFARYNVRSNVNAQLYDWVKVGANIGYTNRNTQSPATRFGRNPGSAAANVFRWINGQSPLISLFARDKDGNIRTNPDGSNMVHVKAGDSYSPVGPTKIPYTEANLIKLLDDDIDTRASNDLNLKGYATFNFLKDFSLTTNISYDRFSETRTRYGNAGTGPYVSTKGAFGKVYQNVAILDAQQLLNWGHTYGKHALTGMAGHEYYEYNLDNMNFNSAYGLIDGFATYANFVGRYTGGTFSSPGGNMVKTAMESYFGRLSYIYDEKYYLEASVRRDGSSKFKYKDTRWGTFWSVGGGWRISAEEFMKGTNSWLNDLKIRSSYGIIGNQSGIGNYSGYQTWSYGAIYTSSTSGTGTPASYTLSQGAFVNDGLTWENTQTLDAGVDFTMFKRVHGSIDWYNKHTTNSVYNQPIAISLGQSTLTKNSAGLRNRGIEVDVNVDIIKTKNINWTVGVNGTHYTTVLTKVPVGVGSEALNGNWTAGVDGWAVNGGGSTGETAYLRGVGKDYYNLYFFKYGGVDNNTGLPLFYHKVTQADVTAGRFGDAAVGSDVKTTDYSLASRYEMGSALPKWIGGFNTSFRYKQFDFSAILAYQLGGKFLSVEYANGLYINGNIGSALSSELLGNTWTPENRDAKFPMALYGNAYYTNGATIGSWMYSDLGLFSASYLNIKNLSIGYNLPPSLLAKIKASNFRVFASADNVAMITGHSGYDPRMSLVGGLEVGAYGYPYMSTVSMGVNLTF
jgi:TonB-linked SusC/RagA family outer membrane protein